MGEKRMSLNKHIDFHRDARIINVENTLFSISGVNHLVIHMEKLNFDHCSTYLLKINLK